MTATQTVNLACAAAWCAIALACIVSVLLKPTPTPTPVPEDATPIGPGYMRVWTEGRFVFLTFANTPGVRVRFDRKAVPELVAWMQTLDA